MRIYFCSRFVVERYGSHPDVAEGNGVVVILQGQRAGRTMRDVFAHGAVVGYPSDGLMVLHHHTIEDHCDIARRRHLAVDVKMRCGEQYVVG